MNERRVAAGVLTGVPRHWLFILLYAAGCRDAPRAALPPAWRHGLAEVTTSARGTALDLVLTTSETCAAVIDGPHADEQLLELFLFARAPGDTLDTAAVRAGTYRVDRGGPGPYVEAALTALDDRCVPITHVAFTTGEVVVTAIAGGSVTGTFALDGPSGKAAGRFTTVACPGANALTAANAGACARYVPERP